jgi:heptosyltransferase-1
VLVVRVGAMGDVLHALPAVAALRRARPEWEMDWVVDPRWAPLLVGDGKMGPVVGKVQIAETKAWSKAPLSVGTLRSVRGLRAALRELRYDLVVDVQGTLRSAVIGRMAGAKELVGFADPREAMAGRFYSRRVVRSGVHVVEQNVALLSEACGVALEAESFALPLTEWAENWAEREAVMSRPLCLLAPGAGWGAKQWPAERFGALAKVLRGMGYDVVVNAAREGDALAGEVIAASALGDGRDAARVVVCNVAGLVALMRRTDLMVGGDSGPMHLAAALAVPTVALFGPTDPARNGPWGPGSKVVVRDRASVTSYKRREEVDAGMASISVERVVEAVKSLI